MKAPVNLERSPRYLARQDALDGERRLSLALAEEGIAADPHGGLHRRDGPDGTIIDTSQPFLLVIYRLVDERTAFLVSFLDTSADDPADQSGD